MPTDAIAEMSNDTTSYVLHYCNQTFKPSDAVNVSTGEKLQNIQFRLRVHVMTPSVLDIPILHPKPPIESFEFNVSSSAVTKHSKVNLKEVVEVQV